MITPASAIDKRFSQPGAAATEWDETLQALESAQLFWISTVRANGRPHVTPLVAVWLDGALHFCTGAEEQKAVNLRGNHHVVLTTGTNQWDSGLDVMVEGEAVAVTDQERLRQLAQAWTIKWDGRWQYQLGDGCFHHAESTEPILVFSVSPKRILAFARGTFSHTTHRF